METPIEKSPERLTVSQMENRWEQIDRLPLGTPYSSLTVRQMPPWEDICSELDWEFHMQDGGNFGARHHGYWGVYRLVALATEGNPKPAALNRVAGLDASGTLYIGESKSLNMRLNDVLNLRHEAISMLKQLSRPDFAFPPKKIGIALLFTVVRPRVVEGDLIRAYINFFCDTPPLNYRL